MNRIAITLVILAGLAGLAGLAHGQTISPIYNECKVKCSGSFEVTNNSLAKMAVTIEPHTFAFTDGQRSIGMIDPSVVEVKLSETSARLSPQETHSFEYKVKCFKTPCAVTFLAGMIIGHTNEGMAVRLVLNSSVYACDKEKGCRASVVPAEMSKKTKTETETASR